jgi:ATP-binding cassette subfamily F protein uup
VTCDALRRDLIAGHATDHAKLLALDAEPRSVRAEREETEEQWLEPADDA